MDKLLILPSEIIYIYIYIYTFLLPYFQNYKIKLNMKKGLMFSMF